MSWTGLYTSFPHCLLNHLQISSYTWKGDRARFNVNQLGNRRPEFEDKNQRPNLLPSGFMLRYILLSQYVLLMTPFLFPQFVPPPRRKLDISVLGINQKNDKTIKSCIKSDMLSYKNVLNPRCRNWLYKKHGLQCCGISRSI